MESKYDPDEVFSAERKKEVSAFDLPENIPFDTLLRIYGIEKPRRTNADCIRAMSDEELAEKMSKQSWWNCPPRKEKGCPGGCGCRACWLAWLKGEAEDDLWQS